MKRPTPACIRSIAVVAMFFLFNTGYFSEINIEGIIETAPGGPVEYHSNINIDGDSGFTSSNGVSGGTGSIENPYVIENLTMNATSSHGIHIKNTDSFFMISNCTLLGPGLNQFIYGIYLEDVSNGSITGCDFFNNSECVHIEDCMNISIKDSTLENFTRYGTLTFNTGNLEIENNRLNSSSDICYGISARSSNGSIANNTINTSYHGIDIEINMTVRNNTIVDTPAGMTVDGPHNHIIGNTIKNSHTGISISHTINDIIMNNRILNGNTGISFGYGCKNVSVINNSIFGCSSIGIRIERSEEIILYSNTLEKCGLHIDDGNVLDGFIIPPNNTIDGKRIAFLKNMDMEGIGISDDFGMLILKNITNLVISGLSISNLPVGIDIHHSTNISVTRCNFTNITICGISCRSSSCCISNNTLINCSGNDNVDGDYGDFSEDGNAIFCNSGPTTIENNTITGCTGAGISFPHALKESIRVRSNAISYCNLGIFTLGSHSPGDYKPSNILNNTINDCDYGIRIRYGANINVASNVVTSNRIGLKATDIKNGLIENNYFTLNREVGAFIGYQQQSVMDCRIRNNTFHFNTGEALEIQGYNMDIQNNNFINNVKNGIKISFSRNCRLINNTVSNNNIDGINIHRSKDLLLENNLMNGNENNGLNIFDENNNKNLYISIKNNSIAGNYIGMKIESGSHSIINNTVRNSSIGILLYGDMNSISGNRIEDNDVGIQLDNTRSNKIFNNIFINARNFKETGINDNQWSHEIIEEENILGYDHSGGNYWSDYNGLDTDGDGLGDTEVPHGPGDEHPIVHLPRSVEVTETTIDEPETGELFDLSFKITYKGFARVLLIDLDIIFTGPNGLISEVLKEKDSVQPDFYYNITIIVPDESIYLDYSISVEDVYGNEDDIEDRYEVIDIIAPKIQDFDMEKPRTGRNCEITLSVYENTGLQSLDLFYSFDREPNITHQLNWENGPGKPWRRITFNIKMDEGSTEISISVKLLDRNGNLGTYTPDRESIMDVTPPTIIDLYDGRELKENDIESLDFVVSDNIELKDVEIAIKFEPICVIMSEHPEERDGIWSFTFQILNYTNSIEYIVTARDSTGNKKIISNTVNVTQVENLSLEDQTEGYPETGRSFDISFGLELKYSAKLVDIVYRFDEGEWSTIKGKNEYTIEYVPLNSRTLHYGIEIIDGFDRSYSMYSQLNVIDVTPPNITYHHGRPETGQIFEIETEVHDNREWEQMKLEVYIKNKWLEIDAETDNHYRVEIPEDMNWLFIRGIVFDDSGNMALENLSLMVSDGSAPIIEEVRAGVINTTGKHEIHFSVNVTDNREISVVRLNYRISEGELRSIEINRYLDDEFRGTLSLERAHEDLEIHFFMEAVDISENTARTDDHHLTIEHEKAKEKNEISGLLIFISIIIIIVIAIIGFLIFRRRTFQEEIKEIDPKRLPPQMGMNNALPSYRPMNPMLPDSGVLKDNDDPRKG